MAIGEASRFYDMIGVYILKCSNGRYYTGSTNNIDRRLLEHQRGYVLATKHILPLSLVFFQPLATLSEARRLEYIIKSKKSKKIIEKIVVDGVIKFMGL